MIDLDFDDGDMLFAEFLFRQELKKKVYNQPIVLDKNGLPKGLNIKSIGYKEITPTCEYCDALLHTKNCLLLTIPEEVRKAIFDDPFKEDNDNIMGYINMQKYKRTNWRQVKQDLQISIKNSMKNHCLK